MSVASLREQMQMARINRVKRRLHVWWHQTNCDKCRARAGFATGAGGGLAQLLQQLGVSGVEIVSAEDDAGSPHPSTPNKAH